MSSMYEHIMTLPLFKGASLARMSEVIETLPMDFLRFGEGERIAAAGEACMHVKFVLSGAVKIVVNWSGELSLTQTLAAPDVICPDFLFGMNNAYPGEIIASGAETSILQISKTDYLKVLKADEVFMFNYLNLLARDAQLSLTLPQNLLTASDAERIACWMYAATQSEARDIVLRYEAEGLCKMLGMSHQQLLDAVQQLSEIEGISCTFGKISVASRRVLRRLTTAALGKRQ